MIDIINIDFSFYFQPGVYKITNETTGRSYFGESQNIGIRFGQHYTSLVVGNHSNALFQEEWNLLEKTHFSWHIVEIGPEWSDSEKRVAREVELIATFSPNVYNKPPQKFQKGQLPVSANAVLVGDVVFSSLAEAALANDVPFKKAVQMAEKKENGWSYVDSETVLKRREKYADVSIRVSVEGIVFASISECARAYNITSSTVKKRVKSVNFPAWIFLDQEQVKKNNQIGLGNFCSVIINGQQFESMQAAADFHGIHRNTVYNRCKSNNPKFADWKILPK